MPRYARKAKTTSRYKRVSRYNRRANRYSRKNYRILSRRISAVSRRVAGEVCKFESYPSMFSNTRVIVGTSATNQQPLNTITSGNPWIMPLNWIYEQATGVGTGSVYFNGNVAIPAGTIADVSFKNPLWYNTSLIDRDSETSVTTNTISEVSPGLQYRLKYIYVNALFNASIASSVNNTDGALRIVVVKDKQPTGGSATWYDSIGENSRGVFNANTINAQLNPNTVGRFKIMYDKTLRFTTISGYKPFKYYRKLSTVVRNNRDFIPSNRGSTSAGYPTNLQNQYGNLLQTSDKSPPVQKNAFYLMIFSDGLTFTYSANNQSETPAAGFKLFAE